ncbi:MAG: zinc ribbon domain-containing protein [Ktedonobacteraceae bacterium]|nr:zinc ribbon domain-containing protein [Ktedonobacteraceae bacterium]MBO0791541.1 zinc ribbon domain-containing protein [Ktedonobacteraceae bacterium]
MPVYEFVCPACRTHFDELRPAREADDRAWCPTCATEAVRQLSRFAFKKATRGSASDATTSVTPHARGCACCLPSPSRSRRG